MPLPRFNFILRQFFGLFLLFLFSFAVPLTVYLVSQKQEFRKRAQETQGAKQGYLPPPNRPPVVPLLSVPAAASAGVNTPISFNSFDFDGQKALTEFTLGIHGREGPDNDPEQYLRNKLKALKQSGVDLIHVNLPWSQLEPQENQWNEGWINTLKKRLRIITDEYGFLLQLQMHLALNEPKWFREKYPDIDFVSEEGKKVRDYYGGGRIEYPNFWHPQTKITFTHLLEKFKQYFLDDPNLKGKVLMSFLSAGFWGEPHYPIIFKYTIRPPQADVYFFAYDAYAQAEFRNDMKQKYGNNLTSANQTWGTTFTNWDQVRPPKPGEFTTRLWEDFLNWYRDDKNAYVSWAAQTAASYSDRPFYTTGIVDVLSSTDWSNATLQKGVGGVSAHVGIKRGLDSGSLIPQFTTQHFWTSPADLPGGCLNPPLPNWNCNTGKMIQQSWGKGYGVPIIGESGGGGKPEGTADVVINYGLDGMRYVYNTTDLEVFNTDGTPNQNFDRVKTSFQRVKNYRDLTRYTDRVKYTIDWGDGTTITTDFKTPGVFNQVSHTWNQAGTYQVKVKAEDKFGASSFWSSPVALNVITVPTPTPTPNPTSTATLADYWQGKAKWQFVKRYPEILGHAENVAIVGDKWYLFDTKSYGTPPLTGCSSISLGTQVRVSTDKGQTWSNPVQIIIPQAADQQNGKPAWGCIATDGDAYYNTSENKWHYLFQCLRKDANWDWGGCHVVREGNDPMGLFHEVQGQTNPVIRMHQLWDQICDQPGDHCSIIPGGARQVSGEGTFQIIKYDAPYYFVSFHGVTAPVPPNTRRRLGFRGIAKTPDFVNWIAGDSSQGVPSDAIFDLYDQQNWREQWDTATGPIGFGGSGTLSENGYYYTVVEGADKSLGCTDYQNWDIGIFRSQSLTNTSWEQLPAGNPIFYSDGNTACNPTYTRLFRDPQTNITYLQFARAWFTAAPGLYLYQLVPDNNLLQNGDLWKCHADNWQKTSIGSTNLTVRRYPNKSSDGGMLFRNKLRLCFLFKRTKCLPGS